MHELSFAKSVLDEILKEAQKHNAKNVKRVEIEMGELAAITADELEFTLSLIVKETIAEGMEVQIERVPLKVRCEKGHENEIEVKREHHHMVPELECPECEGSVRVLQGDECILRRIIAD